MTNLPKKYLLGLDLGTDSVGWALTDENYNVIKKSGKSLWGVRLFDAASDCAERRTHRADRRRLQRRKERIELLKELFGEEVGKVDFTFFERIEESFLHKEDRSKEYDYSLFIEKDFNDKTYYKKYPTIYHLRKHLLESNEKEDIRLIYLALAHMIKYRGHFLFETPDFKPSNKDDAKNIFDKINEVFKTMDEEEYELPFNDEIFGKLIAANKASRGITSLIDKLKEILNPLKKKLINEVLIPLIAGGRVDISKIFEVEDFTDIKKICCKKESFDEDVNFLMSAFPQHESILTVVQYCKELCNFFILDKLLNGKKYLSDAMVDSYNTHKMDLDKLKKYIKENYKEEYFNIFRDTSDKKGKNEFNYVHYIGGNTNNNIKVRLKHCNKDDFYKYIKEKIGLKDVENRKSITDEYLLEIFDKIADGSYLARQNSTDNGVFPYQLNKLEMKIILEKQSKFYDFFNKKDEYGNVANKILSILEYKIPYYVGPLNGPKDENKNNFSWVVRTKEKITPWNFEKVVDLEGSAEAFIYRMLNKCQYLPSCYCLAKSSIIYQYYCVLSELNKILINNEEISVEQKKDLLKNLYLENKNVTKKALIAFFKGRYGEDVVITTSTGKELEEVHSNMSSLIDFKNIFGLSFVKQNLDKIEEIIRDITLFEDKKILSKRLESKYGIKDKETINKIKSFSYKKYGRLSKELLFSIHGIDEQGEIVSDSIISIMENTNYNLMEIINNVHYRMGEAIKRFNMEHSQFDNQNGTSEEVENYINDLYVSPGMKRPLIQSYKIIEELEGIVKHHIDEFYVECTRSNQQEKVRKDSRYFNAQNLLKSAIELAKKSNKTEVDHLKQVEQELLGYEINKSALKSDKIYLYFTQLGKCLYTGTPIDLNGLNNSDRYDIDHIIPQALVKDDSLSNKVLVTSEANRNKKDVYPIVYNDTENYKHKGFITMLYKMKLISEKKKDNLLRDKPLNEDELYNFVDRQLVFTSQSVKALCDLLNTFKVKDDNSAKVIYSKAENVSDFRKKYDILKCRDANNYHHAHDAYLNVVVGRMIYNYYNFATKEGRLASFKKEGKATNISRIFDDNKTETKSPIVDSQNNIVWDYHATLPKVKNQIYNHYDILTTTRTYVDTPLFAKTSIKKASEFKGDNLMPRKDSDVFPLNALKDVSKYGGFSDLSFCSYTLLKSKDKKGKEVYSIEAMPALLSKKSVEEQLEYFASKKKLIDPEVVIETLKINTVIKMGSSKCCITGKAGGDSYHIKNLKETNYSYDEINIIRKISKFYEVLKNGQNGCFLKDGKIDNNCDFIKFKPLDSYLISPAKNDSCEQISITLNECKKLINGLFDKCNKNIYSNISGIYNLKKIIKQDENLMNNLNIFEYTVLLHEIIVLFKCDSARPDLRIINLAKEYGNPKMTKNLKSKIEILYESITGFYVKTIWKN